MKGTDNERFKNDPLYRFFTMQIDKVTYEIKVKSRQIKKLTDEQIVLKRGKTELVKLRRELDTKR